MSVLDNFFRELVGCFKREGEIYVRERLSSLVCEVDPVIGQIKLYIETQRRQGLE